VIRESCQIGYSWIRSNARKLGINYSKSHCFEEKDIHVHFPAGSTPKDGPSAGITIVTALVSLLTNTPVNPLIAMTGEITLRGLVLPVGGIKEKLIAAHRAGIKKVLIPYRNAKDLDQIPATVRDDLEIIPCKSINDVLYHAGLGSLEVVAHL
jgi:ATP-dependent Lon protease